jgi:GNAT superfamily N-acetyltransferase
MSRNNLAKSDITARCILRETRPAEVDSIVDIARSLEVFTPEELECLREDIGDFLSPDSDPDKMYTVFVDKKIAGFIHYGPLPITDRSMMLFWIFVAPEVRSTGVASYLMDIMEKDAVDAHCRILFIETSDNKTFEPAKKFYLKNGYKLACVIADYYEKDHGKAVFSKTF